jgi:hypothetical protein
MQRSETIGVHTVIRLSLNHLTLKDMLMPFMRTSKVYPVKKPSLNGVDSLAEFAC